MMSMYKIDDGVDHWVIATSEADALAVYRETGVGPDPGDDVDSPDVVLLTHEQAEATKFFGDGYEAAIGTMQSEYERDSSRRYVGCSEW
jgi:hypothetical protein